MKATKAAAVLGSLAALACLALADPAARSEDLPFGYVYLQFPLNTCGFDTAGGVTPDENYFNAGDLQIRDRNGGLVGTIALPDLTIYGVAHDGTNLFVSGPGRIYRHLGGNLWSDGLGVGEANARGLGASATDFYLVTDNGANIARINKQTGATLNKYEISGFTDIDGGLGLDYIPATNELIITDGTSNIIRAHVSQDYSQLDRIETVRTSGLGASGLLGCGYNRATGAIVLNDNETMGKYAEGIGYDLNGDGYVDAADLGIFEGCASGPAVHYADWCGVADFDDDGDVDQSDFGLMQVHVVCRLPSGRARHGMSFDASRGRVVMFGGTAGGNETWEWNGQHWLDETPTPPAPSPSSRTGPAMSYDASQGVTVLFGGYATGYNGETWGWDGAAWTNMTPAPPGGSPSGRDNAAMAYDAIRHVSVLFGGRTGDNARSAETWQWNTATHTWTQVTPPYPQVSPEARQYHAMAYDSVRDRVVLFGGHNGSTNKGDTWEWDGALWTEVATGGTPGVDKPTPRHLHKMAYDAHEQAAVLFGGHDGSAFKSDTWHWNGVAWTNVTPTAPAPSPSARYAHAMTYDSARQVTVFFGGWDGYTYFQDTWEWNASAWLRR